MSRRLMAVLWLVIGFAVFNAFFDLYVSRGAREYLQKRAEYERDGWIMSTIWAGLVVGAGWTTLSLKLAKR